MSLTAEQTVGGHVIPGTIEGNSPESAYSEKLADIFEDLCAKVVTGAGANPLTYSLVNSVSLAELNAGKTLLAAVAGRTITVVDWSITAVGGNATAATAVTLSDTAGSPVLIATVAVAALTTGVVVKPNSSDVTDGAAGIGLGCTAAKGITIEKTGSDMTTSTDFTVTIQYTIA